MPKPRVMMIIHNYRPGPTGGAEIQAERLAGSLAALGHGVQILTRRSVPESPREEVAAGVRIHRNSSSLPQHVFLDAGNTFRFLVQHRGGYDLLHAHMALGHAAMAVVVARVLRKACIVKIACAGEYGDLHAFSRLAHFEEALAVLRQADRMVAVSREVEQELLEFGFLQGRIARIPNGVDVDYFRPGEAAPRTGRSQFILVGRRHPQKGIDLVLRAAQILQRRGLGKRLLIRLHGTDYPEHDYRALAEKLAVLDMVEFLPFEQDIRSAYLRADGFLLPSRGEGLSNSLLEAMAMGLPVISTPVSGAADVIEPELDGVVIPPESPEALADAMIRVAENPGWAAGLGRRAREKVEQRFSLDRTAAQYSELYTHLCRRQEQKH